MHAPLSLKLTEHAAAVVGMEARSGVSLAVVIDANPRFGVCRRGNPNGSPRYEVGKRVVRTLVLCQCSQVTIDRRLDFRTRTPELSAVYAAIT